MHNVLTSWRNTLGLFFTLACSYAPVGWAASIDEAQAARDPAFVYIMPGDAGSTGDAPVSLDERFIEARQSNMDVKMPVVPDMPQDCALRREVLATDESAVPDANRGTDSTNQDEREPAASNEHGPRAGSPGINTEIATASNQVSFGYGKLHQDYREFNDGLVPVLPGILDSETGRMDSFRLAYNGLFSRLYIQANLNYSSGDTDYVGYLQSFPGPVYTPFTTTTRNTIFDLNERVGYTVISRDSSVVVPYIELGEFYWSREIGRSTIYYSGAEEYSHLSLGIGAKLLFSPVRQLVLELGAGGGYIVLGDMTTQGNHYTLGQKPYLSGYASADYRFVENWHLKLSADYRKWEYGQSDIVAGAIEPHSETVQTQYLLSVGYSF